MSIKCYSQDSKAFFVNKFSRTLKEGNDIALGMGYEGGFYSMVHACVDARKQGKLEEFIDEMVKEKNAFENNEIGSDWNENVERMTDPNCIWKYPSADLLEKSCAGVDDVGEVHKGTVEKSPQCEGFYFVKDDVNQMDVLMHMVFGRKPAGFSGMCVCLWDDYVASLPKEEPEFVDPEGVKFFVDGSCKAAKEEQKQAEEN